MPIFKLGYPAVKVRGDWLDDPGHRGFVGDSSYTRFVMKAKHIDNFEALLDEADVKCELWWDKEFVAGMQMLYAKLGCDTPVSDKKLNRLLDIVDFCNR